MDNYGETLGKISVIFTIWPTILFVIALFIGTLVVIRTKKPRKRESAMGILAVIICIEMFASSTICMSHFYASVGNSSYSSYNDFFGRLRPVVNELKECDPSFYRTEKTHHRNTNDNMTLNIKGVSNSTSTLNSDTINFLKYFGFNSKSHNSVYVGQTPVSNSLLGIKYIIDPKNYSEVKMYNSILYNLSQFPDNYVSKLDAYYGSPVIDLNGYYVYRNDYALSFAYGVDGSVRDFNLEEPKSPMLRMNALVSQMLGEDTPRELFIPVKIKTSEITLIGCESGTYANHNRYTKKEGASSASVTYKVDVPKSGEVFFYAPTQYHGEILVYANEKLVGKTLHWDNNYNISLGFYNEGDVIDVRIQIQEESFTIMRNIDYFWVLDNDLYRQTFGELLANPQYIIDDTSTDGHLTGTLKTDKENQMIMTTIPFDKGWNIYLDGKRVEIYEILDAVIAFDVPSAGEHTLEMVYMPKIYIIGMIGSLAGIGIFILFCVSELLLKKIILKKRYTGASEIPFPDTWILEDFDEDYEQLKYAPPIVKKPQKLSGSISTNFGAFQKKPSKRKTRLRISRKSCRKIFRTNENSADNTEEGKQE